MNNHISKAFRPHKNLSTYRSAVAASRSPLTHFLCLPLVTKESRSQLSVTLKEFREDVLATELGQESILEDSFRPLGTLHLTLGVMSLVDPEKLMAVQKLLSSLDLHHLLSKGDKTPELAESLGSTNEADIGAPHLTISLVGVSSMYSPSRTSILYTGTVDDSGRLYPFCIQVRNAFVQQGLVIPQERPFLLHATILNTKYAQGSFTQQGGVRSSSPKNWKASTINATRIIDKYRDKNWISNMKLEKLTVCKMGAEKVYNDLGLLSDEKYEVVLEKSIL